MKIHYLTDSEGNRVAVVVSLAEWEALQSRAEFLSDELTLEEAAASEAAWQDFLAGRTKHLAQVIKEQLHDR